MKQTDLFVKTLRDSPKDEKSLNAELLLRAGFVDKLASGVYTYLPVGLCVIKTIKNIIREEMNVLGSQEILMPALTPKENWEKTKRFDVAESYKIKDEDFVLGWTHEEIVTPLMIKHILSYKDLPLSVFQIQTKFRDELRAKSGILRTREFLMKDLYSFHENQEDLDKYYDKMIKVYFNIFKELGIKKDTYLTLASGGTFSKYSHEFQMVTDTGEDTIYICNKCKTAINKEIKDENPVCPNCHPTGDLSKGDSSDSFQEKMAVEVGNIFKLGTKYSLPFDLKFRDKDGIEKPVLMGCFGIGLSRAMGSIVEVCYDDKGIIWPKEVAPFLVHLIPVEKSDKVKRAAEKIYEDLSSFEVLYDDRQDKSAGEKFAEADLIGIPLRVVVSEKTLAKNSVELKERAKNSAKLVKINKLAGLIK